MSFPSPISSVSSQVSVSTVTFEHSILPITTEVAARPEQLHWIGAAFSQLFDSQNVLLNVIDSLEKEGKVASLSAILIKAKEQFYPCRSDYNHSIKMYLSESSSLTAVDDPYCERCEPLHKMSHLDKLNILTNKKYTLQQFEKLEKPPESFRVLSDPLIEAMGSSDVDKRLVDIQNGISSVESIKLLIESYCVLLTNMVNFLKADMKSKPNEIHFVYQEIISELNVALRKVSNISHREILFFSIKFVVIKELSDYAFNVHSTRFSSCSGNSKQPNSQVIAVAWSHLKSLTFDAMINRLGNTNALCELFEQHRIEDLSNLKILLKDIITLEGHTLIFPTFSALNLTFFNHASKYQLYVAGILSGSVAYHDRVIMATLGFFCHDVIHAVKLHDHVQRMDELASAEKASHRYSDKEDQFALRKLEYGCYLDSTEAMHVQFKEQGELIKQLIQPTDKVNFVIDFLNFIRFHETETQLMLTISREKNSIGTPCFLSSTFIWEAGLRINHIDYPEELGINVFDVAYGIFILGVTSYMQLYPQNFPEFNLTNMLAEDVKVGVIPMDVLVP